MHQMHQNRAVSVLLADRCYADDIDGTVKNTIVREIRQTFGELLNRKNRRIREIVRLHTPGPAYTRSIVAR